MLDTALLALYLLASVGDLLIVLVSEAMDLILTFKDSFLFLCFGSLHSVGDDALGFLLSAADLCLRDLLAVRVADDGADTDAEDQSDYYEDDA